MENMERKLIYADKLKSIYEKWLSELDGNNPGHSDEGSAILSCICQLEDMPKVDVENLPIVQQLKAKLFLTETNNVAIKNQLSKLTEENKRLGKLVCRLEESWGNANQASQKWEGEYKNLKRETFDILADRDELIKEVRGICRLCVHYNPHHNVGLCGECIHEYIFCDPEGRVDNWTWKGRG